MVNYRRLQVPGAMYFFTVTLLDRKSNMLVKHVDLLKAAMIHVCNVMPYSTNAMVILPDHLHTIWELPEGDANFSIRWMKIKSHFTRGLIKRGESLIKNSRNEYNLWQRRFWEHMIRNEIDHENHVNYIHYNPVKHGFVNRVRDWPYSSFHKYAKKGIVPLDWSDNVDSLNYSHGITDCE